MSERQPRDESIPIEMLRELIELLERNGYWGKVELTFQARLVRIHLSQPMKQKELREYLQREKRIDSIDTSLS